MSYREFRPSAELRNHVECYWSREESAGEDTHRVLPDGCVDILVERTAAGEAVSVVGTMTKAIVVPSSVQRVFTAVRFRPGGAFGFFRVPMRDLSDQSVGIRDLWDNTAGFVDRIAACTSVEDRIRALDRDLLKRLVCADQVDSLVQAALARIQRSFGQLRVDVLSRELGVSRQHLTRKFDEQVGLSTKLFSRVWRLQDVVRRVDGIPDVDWCAVALDSGYYDQAHLIGEFKDLVGLTPNAFRNGEPRRGVRV